MKKTICFLLLMCILFGLTACAEKEQKKYDVYEVGEYCYMLGAAHTYELEVPYMREDVEKKDIDFSGTFTWGGSTFTMRERGVDARYGYHQEMNMYYGEILDETGDVRQSLHLGINPYNGRYDLVAWLSKDYLETVSGPTKSREECLAVAKQHISQYVSDVEAYELYWERFDPSGGFEARYEFSFARYVDDVGTADTAMVMVSVYGDVITYRFECLGEMQDAVLPSEDELSAMEASAVAKMDTIYENLRDRYDIVYGEPELRFTRLYDGRYAMKYIYNVEYTSKETQITGKERTELLIFVA